MQKAESGRIWGESVGGVKLSIEAAKGQYVPGEPIDVNVLLANGGSSTIQFPRVSEVFEYEYKLTAPNGQVPPFTESGKKQHDALALLGGVLLDINAGAHRKTHVDLSEIYNLSAPGEYHLRASKVLRKPSDGEYVRVTSNMLQIVIHEKSR